MTKNIFSGDVTLPAIDTTSNPVEPNREVHLIIMAGTNVGQVFPLAQESMLVGRDDQADIQILDGGISRKHAMITWDAGSQTYYVRDMGSRNGVLINDERISAPQALRKGDKIQLGLKTVLRVSFSDELETQYANRMYQAVLRDGLTGVFNRRYFDQRLESEVAFAARHHTPLSLLLLDIDHFKSINDTYGHQWGDHILQQFSGLVGNLIRTEDVLARYGGEEFAVVCRETNEQHAAILAERIRETMAERRYDVGETQIQVTVSVGIAEYSAQGPNSAANLVKSADEALYRAKNEGRNRVSRFSQGRDSET